MGKTRLHKGKNFTKGRDQATMLESLELLNYDLRKEIRLGSGTIF